MMEQNGTLMLSLDGFVDVDKYRYVYLVFFLALYVLILCCNCIIICVIWIHRNLHEPMYIFIAALCLNSLFFSTAIYPKLVVAVLSHQQSVSYSGCLVQVFFFYSLGGSDIMLLLAMSYDRYVSICKPLQYASTMGTTSVIVLLALAWFLPACQLSVTVIIQSKQKICSLTLSGFFCNAALMKIHCTLPTFLAVWTSISIANIGLIPVLIIVFTYIKILMVAYNSHREVQKKALDTCLPHMIVLALAIGLIVFDVIIELLDSRLPKSAQLVMSLQTLVYNPLFNPIIYGLKMKDIRKHIVNRLPPCGNHVDIVNNQVK